MLVIFMYCWSHPKQIYIAVYLIPDPLGDRSPLPVPPSLMPALEEFEDWEGILNLDSSLPTKVSVIQVPFCTIHLTCFKEIKIK